MQSEYPTAKQIQLTLKKLSDPLIAEHSQRFFKTGKGEYGYGDKFLGIRVPVLRQLVKTARLIQLSEIQHLLNSPFHEQRLLALLLLVDKYKRGSKSEKDAVYDMYLKNTIHINNWDLVDCSAYKIVGPHVFNKNRKILFNLANSASLWERRISIMSTFYFIKHNDYEDTLKLSLKLLNDKHDLIHKAVGWMLREVGNRNIIVEKIFLKQHYRKMPRTMLRYAIEKFPAVDRKKYLQGEI